MSPLTMNRRTATRVAIALGVVLVVIVCVVISLSSGSKSGSANAASPSPSAKATQTAAGATEAAADPDLACGKPATASSTAAGANPASDTTACGSTASWISGSAGGAEQWLQVDLGASTTVDHITVVWGTDYARRFKVRTSDDGSSWHSVEEVTDGAGGSETLALPSGTDTRWVQLYLEKPAKNAATVYSVVQFEVFALPSGAGSSAASPLVAPATSTAVGSGASGVSGGSTPAAWTGQFAGYGTAAWKTQWGYTDTGQFGQADLSEVTDPTAPGGGSALRVYYGPGSSSNSCTDCPNPGGGQFYQKLSDLGAVGTQLANSETLDLKYSIKLPAGWDFGEAGKLPGLYGGTIGQESGGTHGTDGWSTRYMFRGHDGTPNAGEVYLYTPTNSGPTGYGVDYFGNWNWTADGAWHTVEQLVNRQTGSVTVWFDGKEVLQDPDIATGISGIAFSGVFFSTFFGGHDTTWGPKTAEYSYFADFSLSTTIQH